MAEQENPFWVGRMPKAARQIEELIAKASALGNRSQFLQVLNDINLRLSTDPLGLGYPLYRTKHPGGVVCHALQPPINIHFVVYEIERKVLILKMGWLEIPKP